MSRADDGQGAYFLDIDSFHHVYNFICRFVKRNEKDVQTVLFTVNEENQEIDVTEMELILETLEKAIYTSLRRSDVSTRYSSKQIVVILMDTDEVNGSMVADRILIVFIKMYSHQEVQIDYDIAASVDRTYIAIDLKSFYASVECKERNRDPLTTNLVVADQTRTEKTICLAVSPALKSYGIPGRPRLLRSFKR